ncbi:MAG: ATP-dependent zinc metalloprotease FtsH [Oscillospiraceae bacterium]|nr:ATP-dependent zinc metalloprotease FtsH [Oscillospiraceae bacterium]
MNLVIYLIVLGLAILLLSGLFSGEDLPEVSYAEMRELFLQEQVRSFEWEDGVLTLELHGDKETESPRVIHLLADVEMFRDDLSSTYERQLREGIIEDYNFVPVKGTPWYLLILPYLLPILLLGAFMYFFLGRANNNAAAGVKFGKANLRVGSGEKKVTFADVAGVEEEKQELEEIVDFLRNPKKYQAIGARIPKGVLLVGPPGTGKTLIARAVAGEADVQFLSISGSDFVELYVGVGASRVRDLFEQAKKGAPSIVFIDEIDAVGRRRGAGLGGGNDEREQTLNQLLVEMDGFGTNEGVIVMAATNRQDILDPALMRPGRFDRQIYINPPDVQGREAILKVHAKEKLLADDVDFKVIAHATGGFTGADLANLLNEAALYAAKHNSPVITMQALEESILKIIAGPEKRSHVRLERDRRITAYHEAGHAVAMHVLPTQDPVHSITIVPRGNALGMTISLPEEDTDHMTRNEMREKIVGLLGGRVAEKLVFDDISTGASNDIQRASRLARDMIARYGMSERIGTVAFDDGDEIFVGRDYERTKAYSEHTGGEIDAEMKRVIDEAYKRCEDILTENRSKLDEVAAFLLEHETMSRKQFEACMNGEAIPETAEGFFETVESAPEAPADAEASNQ